jgi:dipeptidyl aminopeptidase/acylaminoacyl peptidase
MNADGTGQTNLTQNPASYDHDAAWSPDGSKIAFTSAAYDSKGEIYVMNADGSGQTNLTQLVDDDFDPSWQTLPSADLELSLAASPDVGKAQKPLTYTVASRMAGPRTPPRWS